MGKMNHLETLNWEGEENPSMHEGSEIVPNEFIEFDNNLVKVKQFSEERNGEKDVLASLALMEEMIVNQCMVKRRKNESSKLIAEGAVLKVKERKGKERKGKERKGKERKGKERQGKERKGKERKGKERKGKARQGKARKGKARQGKARQGKARQGKARQGNARQGKARKGKERKGKERQGKA